jgi:exosortase C (VPDSG-CTERM-specific)
MTLRYSSKKVMPQNDLHGQSGLLRHNRSSRWSFLKPVTPSRLTGMAAKWRCLRPAERLRVGVYGGYLLFLMLVFAQPLTKLMLYAARSPFYSYITLVPFISGYLLFTNRSRFSATHRTSIAGTITVAAIAIMALAAALVWERNLSMNDEFSLLALAFVSFVAAGGFLFFGSQWMATMAFPVTFLIFIVPLPDAATKWLEETLALASAQAAAGLFSVSGTPFVREATLFQLPRISLRVAQECSGIHSSWVLFITSLLASHLFLKTGWRKVVLVAFVIPLGILRNGFRILVIGLLCIHVGPQMIDSRIHHRGGPLFFSLSLIPLLLLLLWLRRQEMPLNLRG